MSYEIWKDKVEKFKVADVRGISGNFFPNLKKQAEDLDIGEGIHIVQSFEPIPLYDVMEKLGFEKYVDRISDSEYHAYFYRIEKCDDSGDIAMRPAALTNFPMIDNDLADIAVNFWDLTWNDDRRYLPSETRLLLSLANAVGAGRMRQATRELVKSYIQGVDSRAFDDIFELFAWNQGIGYFSSEIGSSALFAAYKYIKQAEKKGIARDKICTGLKEKFGEKNPDVKVV